MNFWRLVLLALTPVFAASAQSMAPSGSFGFLVNNLLDPTSSDSGTAVLGVMNFDGAGNVAGSVVFQRGSGAKPAQNTAAPLAGTYSSNPDGTGSITATLAGTLTFTFAMVIGDSGQSLQLLETGLVGGDNSGAVLDGFAKAAYAGPLKGSYAFQLNNSPIPAGTLGVMGFDGAGNATMSFTSVGDGSDPTQQLISTGSLSGTYAVNPDGTGTITLPNSAYAFVITDGGSGLLLLQTDGTGHSTSSGIARLQ